MFNDKLDNKKLNKKMNAKIFKNVPPITYHYSIIIAMIVFIPKFFEYKNFVNYLKLDYKKIFVKNEFWRLITPFFYIGKLTPRFFLTFYYYFIRMKSNENKMIKQKKYAEFIMMLIYLMIIIHICSFTGLYFFKIKPNSFLAHELMFSLILINARREPTKNYRYYIINIENKNVPLFLFSLRLAKNQKVINNILGFFPGLAYHWLKDVFPTYGHGDFLITPKFLKKLVGGKNSKKIHKNNNNNQNNDSNQNSQNNNSRDNNNSDNNNRDNNNSDNNDNRDNVKEKID